MKTYYGSLCSRFYDIDKPTAPKEELNFYLSYMRKGMSILEAMCGSGRFLFEVAKRGFSIDGFDLSFDMLERCKERVKGYENVGSLHCVTFYCF